MIREISCLQSWRARILLPAFTLACFLIPGVLLAGPATVVPNRIVQPIDETHLVTLEGNRHPLARPQFDQGAAQDN